MQRGNDPPQLWLDFLPGEKVSPGAEYFLGRETASDPSAAELQLQGTEASLQVSIWELPAVSQLQPSVRRPRPGEAGEGAAARLRRGPSKAECAVGAQRGGGAASACWKAQSPWEGRADSIQRAAAKAGRIPRFLGQVCSQQPCKVGGITPFHRQKMSLKQGAAQTTRGPLEPKPLPSPSPSPPLWSFEQDKGFFWGGGRWRAVPSAEAGGGVC